MRLSGDGEESGAVAVTTAIMIILLVGLASFAVDIGYQRVAARDMQAIADIVAMDMARTLDGKKTGSLLGTTWDTDLADSLDRNDDHAVGEPLRGIPCPANENAVHGSWICASPGIYENGVFSKSGSAPATHVMVQTRTRVDYFFPIYAEDGWVTKTAYASASGNECYTVSSFALGLASNDSLLRAILGPAAAARVLSSRGILSASVSIVGIAAEAGVVTPEELVRADNVTIGRFLDAAVEVIRHDGATADLKLITELVALRGDLGSLSSERIQFGELIDLGQGNVSAADVSINVLDVVTGAIVAADKVHGVAVPGLDVDLGGLGNLHASVSLSEPAKLACNGGTATSAQGRVQLTGAVGSCIITCIDVSVSLNLANATASTAENWACNSDELLLDVTEQELAHLRLVADVKARLLFSLIEVAHVDTGEPGRTAGQTYALPLPATYSLPGVETDAGAIGLEIGESDVNVLPDLPGGGLKLGFVSDLLSPVVDAVLGAVGSSILPALGLKVAGADLHAVPEVECSAPALVR